MNSFAPPLRLPRSTWNRIIDERLEYYASRILPQSEELVDFFPFAEDLPAKAKWQAYVNKTVDLTDFILISDPDYELRVRQGLDQPPMSPFWRNALMIPGEFTRMAAEFVKLNERFAGEDGTGTERQVDNVPGVALPVAQGATGYAPES